MSIYFIRNTRSLLLSVSVVVLCSQFDGFTPNAHALEPSGPDEIDGLVEGQTTYGPNGYWKPYVEADGFIWDKAANNGNLRLWSPLIQNPNWILHTTIGGGFFETDGLQGTAGIGFRHVIGDAILGVYGFADVTFTEHGNTFWRVSPGIELLELNYEARINGYIPLGEDQYLVGNSVAVGGGGAMSGLLEYETNFLGIDGEIGFRLPVEIGEEKLHDFWLYGGANYYDHENTDELYGADARFEWRINKLAEEYPGSRLSFIANASWNNVDDFDYGGGIRARIPLGKKARCFNRYPQERTIDCPTRNGRMDAAVIRRTRGDQIIQQDELLIDPETNVLMRTVVTVNDPTNTLAVSTVPGGSGTLPVPGIPENYTDLSSAANNTDEVLVVVNGGIVGGTPISYSGQFDVDSNTTVLGTGTTIELVGQTTNVSYNYSVAGERPQFDFNGNGAVLDLDGTGIHIAGLGISGQQGQANPNNHGILIQPGGANIAIEQNIVNDFSGNGIHSDGPTTNVRIFNNIDGAGPGFSNIDGDAIHLETNNDLTRIYGNWFEDIVGTAVLFGDGNDDARVTNNTLLNIGANGILFNDDNNGAEITGNTLSALGADGISFGSRNNTAEIAGNSITQAGGTGIAFVDENDFADVMNNTLTNITDHGVSFNNDNDDVNLMGNAIDTAGGDGIRFVSLNDRVTVQDNISIENVVGSGILFTNANTEITVQGNELFNLGNRGIEFQDRNEVVRVVDNLINGTGAAGIRIDSESRDTTVFENRLFNINGVGIVYNNNHRDIKVTFNRIFGTQQSGIAIGNDNVDVALDDNFLQDFGRNGISVGSITNSTLTSSIRNSISNNELYNIIDFNTSGGALNGIVFVNNNLGWDIASNEIYGVNAAGISLGGSNVDVNIFDNLIDGRDWRNVTATTGPVAVQHSMFGIRLASGGNRDVTIGGPGIVSASNPNGYSNRISNVSNFGIELFGANNPLTNERITIDNNLITGAGTTTNGAGGGIHVRRANSEVDVINNVISNATQGIVVGGASSSNTTLVTQRMNTDILLQGNNISNSTRYGIIVGDRNSDISIINNNIFDVTNSITGVNSFDAININTGNTVTELSGNIISGAIDRHVLRFVGVSTFTAPSNNIANNATGVTVLGGLNCSGAVQAGPQVQLDPSGGGGVIDCP